MTATRYTDSVEVIDGDGLTNESFGLGHGETNDSWKLARSGNNVVLQRRETGSWVTKLTLTNAGAASVAALTLSSLLTLEGTVKVKSGSASLADDAEVELPDASTGVAIVFEGTEWILGHVAADGSVTSIAGSTNSAVADTDANLCLYDTAATATAAAIKNRLGAAKVVTYFYIYV